MQVNNAQHSNNISALDKIYASSKQNDAEALSNTEKVTADTISISETGRTAEQKWQEMSEKYDMRNITANEVMTMAKELYDSGLISGSDMLGMYRPEDINWGSNLDTKRDHLKNMTLSLEAIKAHGQSTPEGIRQSERVLELLKRIG